MTVRTAFSSLPKTISHQMPLAVGELMDHNPEKLGSKPGMLKLASSDRSYVRTNGSIARLVCHKLEWDPAAAISTNSKMF